MARATEENLMDWLRDAHAMERQAEQMLTAQAKRIEHYGALKARIEQHIQETRHQAERIEGCIERLGGTTSTLKDLGGKSMAMAQGMSGIFASDEVVKGTMASYTFEHMEIASYQILAATAGMLGDHETKQVCESILREEQAMADWLKDNLDSVTTQYLQRAETPEATAKR